MSRRQQPDAVFLQSYLNMTAMYGGDWHTLDAKEQGHMIRVEMKRIDLANAIERDRAAAAIRLPRKSAA